MLLDGATVTGPGPDRGMVFQSYTLFPWLSIADNIAFGLREQGVREDERRRVAHEWCTRVGLTGFERHYPKQLSGGMQQRTAIARVLANDPKIMLLDEPFGALDNQTRALMQEMLLEIWQRERKTVMFVTHDIEESIFLASRVVVMSARPGRIKADVRIDLPYPRHYTVKTSPEFSALKARLTEEIRVEAVRAAEGALSRLRPSQTLLPHAPGFLGALAQADRAALDLIRPVSDRGSDAARRTPGRIWSA